MVIDLILQFLVRFGSVCHFLTDFTSHAVELAGMVIDLILQFLVRFGSVCYFLTNLSSYTVNLALLIFIYFFHSIQTSSLLFVPFFLCIQFFLLVIDLVLLTFVHIFNAVQTSSLLFVPFFLCIQFFLLVIDLVLLTFVHIFNAVQTSSLLFVPFFLCIQFFLLVIDLVLLTFVHIFNAVQTSSLLFVPFFLCIQFFLLVIDLVLLTFVHIFNAVQTAVMFVNLALQLFIAFFALRYFVYEVGTELAETFAKRLRTYLCAAQGKKDGAGEERGEDGALQRTAGRGLCASHRVIAVNELGAHYVAAARGVPYDFVDLIHTAYPFPCVYTSLVFGLRTEICPRPFFHPTPNRRYIYIYCKNSCLSVLPLYRQACRM